MKILVAPAQDWGTPVRWNRRVYTGAAWVITNLALIFLQPILDLDATLVKSYEEGSRWIAGALIVGLSATDAVRFSKAPEMKEKALEQVRQEADIKAEEKAEDK